MENLNREAILRMLSGKTGNSSSGGGGGDIDLAGYATSIWVTENFVSIDFFRELFRAYDSNSQEILPNDTTSVVASIKAMVGTWTEQYLTALGNGGGGGGGGGGAQYLNDLLDVQLTTPLTDGQALVYNATLAKWVNGDAGVNMTTVWNALAGSTNEQINASHLSTALSGYVTTSDISDMATRTWVGQQGFATQTWVTSNFITIAYFDRLFRAYNGSTLVSHNDTTTTIDNIKAMFGFWTEFYLSALGTGGASSVSISLSQLADVNVAGVTNGQALVYDATSNKWVNGTIQTGVSSLSSLSDVLISSLQHNQVLVYDVNTSKWVNSSLKTINGTSLIGSGDISAGGGGSVSYATSAGYVQAKPLYSFDASTLPRVFDTGVSAGFVYINSGFGNFGTVLVTRTYPDGGGTLQLYAPYSPTYGGTHLKARFGNYDVSEGNSWTPLKEIAWVDDNVASATKLQTARTLWGQSFDGTSNIDGNIFGNGFWLGNSGGLYLEDSSHNGIRIQYARNSDFTGYQQILLGNNMGFRSTTIEAAFELILDDNNKTQFDHTPAGLYIFIHNGSWRTAAFISRTNDPYVGFGTISPSYKLHVVGDVYATGGVTALSDARHKTIINPTDLKVEQIARMPAVVYRWNDGREDKELHVGSIAQNWQTVLPEVVLRANDDEGTLSMQYGVAALVSSIIIARKVVNHEERIRQLEKENKELKERLKIA